MPLLEVEALGARHGTAAPARGVDLAVGEGEAVVLLGPAGAGKSSTLLAIAGVAPRLSGWVLYDGRPLIRTTPERSTRLGVVLVPQGRHVFGGLSVRENLVVGAWSRRDDRRGVDSDLERVFDVFPTLADRRHHPARSLPPAEQRVLELARALMADPRLLLVDQPSFGLPATAAEQVWGVVGAINEGGVTVLMAEADPAATEIADRVYPIAAGRTAVTVPPGPGPRPGEPAAAAVAVER